MLALTPASSAEGPIVQAREASTWLPTAFEQGHRIQPSHARGTTSLGAGDPKPQKTRNSHTKLPRCTSC